MDIRFVLLGSGAVRNNPRRGGRAQFLHVGDQVLMFDCGRSACTNLARAGIAAESVNRLFLTHLHFDHVTDVPYFVFVGWNNGRAKTLRIFGPEGTRQFIDRIIRPPFEQDIGSRMGHGKRAFGLDPEVTEVWQEGEFLVEDGYRVAALFVDHGGGMPNLAYRIDVGRRRVVITGDGLPSPEMVRFSQGADSARSRVLRHGGLPGAGSPGDWHTHPDVLADMASEARIKRVIIKHLVMEDITGDLAAADRMAEQIRRRYDGEVIVGEDLLEVTVS